MAEAENNGATESEVDQLPGDKFNFNTISAILFILLGLAMFWIIPDAIDKPLIVLGASQSDLSAEQFPQVVAGWFVVLGIWFFIKSLSLRQVNSFKDLDSEAFINLAVTLLALAIYTFLMVTIGFVVGSAILIVFLSTFYGNRNFYFTAFTSVVVPLLMFSIFTKLLAVSLPPFPVDEVFNKSWFIYEPIKYLSNKSFF